MKNYILLLIFIIISNFCFAQSDSTLTKIDSLNNKENRFKVAGTILKNSILSVPGDFSEMGHTISSNWKRTAYYTAGIVGLIATDKITTSFLHEHIEPNIKYKLPEINNKYRLPGISRNDPYIVYPIIGLYAGSLVINNKKGQEVALNATKSIIYSYLISQIFLKTISARNRPQRKINDNEPVVAPWTKDNWDFGNFHPISFKANDPYGTSFPSFHATSYFAVAKVFQMEYNNYWIPYTFATGVFLAEIKSHNHWVSDLLVGGLVGTIIGKSVVNSSRKQLEKDNSTALNYNPRKFKMTKQVIPQISSSMVGLHFIGSF